MSEIEYRNGVPFRGGLPDDEESLAVLDAFRPPSRRPATSKPTGQSSEPDHIASPGQTNG